MIKTKNKRPGFLHLGIVPVSIIVTSDIEVIDNGSINVYAKQC
jgi:hypothetical protein